MPFKSEAHITKASPLFASIKGAAKDPMRYGAVRQDLKNIKSHKAAYEELREDGHKEWPGDPKRAKRARISAGYHKDKMRESEESLHRNVRSAGKRTAVVAGVTGVGGGGAYYGMSKSLSSLGHFAKASNWEMVRQLEQKKLMLQMMKPKSVKKKPRKVLVRKSDWKNIEQRKVEARNGRRARKQGLVVATSGAAAAGYANREMNSARDVRNVARATRKVYNTYRPEYSSRFRTAAATARTMAEGSKSWPTRSKVGMGLAVGGTTLAAGGLGYAGYGAAKERQSENKIKQMRKKRATSNRRQRSTYQW